MPARGPRSDPPQGSVRPLHLEVPQVELDDLRERLRRARLPEPETMTGADGAPDWAQGPPLQVLTELVGYWHDSYDWRRVEAELNAHGQALTEIDGLDVHLLHARSPRADARPLIITHGWPSSVLEPLQVIDDLTDPADPAAPAFHVVAPSLPGFGWSGKPAETGWTVERTADAWAVLMRRLGYEHFLAAGGDWGGRVTTALGVRHPERVVALHTFTPYVREPPGGVATLGPLTGTEERWVADTRRFWRSGGGYSLQQSTRPQTLAYGLVDSPVALLAWVLDKFWAWTDHAGDLWQAVSRDQVLDTVTLYWLTASGGSSVRFYWQNFPPDRSEPVEVPSAVSVFPADIEKLPRRWVETRFTRLVSWSEPARGGHFPMLEVPESYAAELRRALGPYGRGSDPGAPGRHGDRRRRDVTEVELVGGVEKRALVLVPYDPSWEIRYGELASRLRAALGEAAVAVHHIGSTSVAGLAAKPIIDILVTVADITAEQDYLAPMLAAGYVLRVREPGHRLVRTVEADVHVHVLEPQDPAAADHLLLRDRLRADPSDRALYERTKRELTTRDWPDMNAYAEAKTGVIEDIRRRARAGPPDPSPNRR